MATPLVEQNFKQSMSRILKKPVERLTDSTPLADLVVESLILVEMVISLQEEFGVRLSQEQLQPVKTVGDLWALFCTVKSS